MFIQDYHERFIKREKINFFSFEENKDYRILSCSTDEYDSDIQNLFLFEHKDNKPGFETYLVERILTSEKIVITQNDMDNWMNEYIEKYEGFHNSEEDEGLENS